MDRLIIFRPVPASKRRRGRLPNQLPGPFAHVQGIASTPVTSGTTLSASFGAAVTSGDLVCGFVTFSDTGSNTVSVSDDKGNTYFVLTKKSDSINNRSATVFYLGNVTNAPTTITVTFGSAVNFAEMVIDEFSGVDQTANPLDVSASNFQSNPGTGANAVTSTAATTTKVDLIYGATANTNRTGAPITAETEAKLETDAGNNVGSEWEPQSSAGLVATTFTIGSS